MLFRSERSSVPLPGEWIVSSELALGGSYGSLAEALAVPLETRELDSRTPLRLMDRFAHSGYFSTAFGLLPFSFSEQPLDRITYARTSPFWDLNAPWIPTQFSGRLVYLPNAGAEIHLPLTQEDGNSSRLHFALFARGSGRVTFRIREPQGGAIFERTVQAGGQEDLWETHSLPDRKSVV